MRKKIKCCVFTSTRAEYGLLKPLMSEIEKDNEMELHVLVTGAHLSGKFGNTYQLIDRDGWSFVQKVPMMQGNDGGNDLSHSVGKGVCELTSALTQSKPDCVIIMGDRFELMSIIPVCTLMGIPMVHISGGEITEGAIDDQIRHAMTKFSHLHYVAADEFAKRVIQMGEEPWRVHVTGEPGIDNIETLDLMSRFQLTENLGINLNNDTALVTFHPVTHELGDLQYQVQALIDALKKSDLQYIITYPNMDPGHNIVIEHFDEFVRKYKKSSIFIESLGQQRYLSLMNYVLMLIGNSSSGIVEAPSFNVPVVNIGNRQKGRIFSNNVISSGYSSGEILRAIQLAKEYSLPAEKNPYANSDASKKIKNSIKLTFKNKSKQDILTKKFMDSALEQ